MSGDARALLECDVNTLKTHLPVAQRWVGSSRNSSVFREGLNTGAMRSSGSMSMQPVVCTTWTLLL